MGLPLIAANVWECELTPTSTTLSTLIQIHLTVITMAADEKILPHFVDSKGVSSLDEASVDRQRDIGKAGKRQARWKFALLGSLVAYALFRYAAVGVYHRQYAEEGQLARPHRIPPKIAEEIFL
jgi:hypothetical protein